MCLVCTAARLIFTPCVFYLRDCFLFFFRAWKKSFVQECGLHEPTLQGQVAVQWVLQRLTFLQEQSARISCVSNSSPASGFTANWAKLSLCICNRHVFFPPQLVWAFCHSVVGRKRGSVSRFSSWRFGERQKRWGKGFSSHLPLSPVEMLLSSHDSCHPSLLGPLS